MVSGGKTTCSGPVVATIVSSTTGVGRWEDHMTI